MRISIIVLFILILYYTKVHFIDKNYLSSSIQVIFIFGALISMHGSKYRKDQERLLMKGIIPILCLLFFMTIERRNDPGPVCIKFNNNYMFY